MTDTTKPELETELAALRKRVAELERAANPPPSPDPRSFQRYDPTAGMSMPVETLREMARAVPDNFIRDIAMRDARAPTGPSAQGVVSSSQQVSNVRGGGGTGWVRETPIGPPPGVNYADRLMDAQDAKDRHERMVEEARRLAMGKPKVKPMHDWLVNGEVNTTSVIFEPLDPASPEAFPGDDAGYFETRVGGRETAEARAQRRWFTERQSHE
jgi:hypothetical protein